MWRRWLRPGLLGLALAATALPGWVVLQGRDLREVADADLVVERLSLPSAENGATWLAAEGSRLPPGILSARELDGVCSCGTECALEWTWLEDVVARSEPALQGVDKVIAARELQVPAFVMPAGDDAVTEYSHAFQRVLCAEARLHVHHGRYAAALDSWRRLGRLGARIESARGGVLVHAMFGRALKLAALIGIHDLLDVHALDPAAARELAREVESWRARPEAWSRMWKAEYRAVRGTWLALRVENPPKDMLQTSIRAVRLGALRSSLYPNRRLAVVASWHRLLAAEAGRPCAQQTDLAKRFGSRFDLYGIGNLVAEHVPQLERYRVQVCSYETRTSLLQAMLALQAHEAEQGELPARLEALVPDYLARVPPDGFDGRPLRYSKATRTVWSVGSDLVDSGGRGDLSDRTEPTLVLPLPSAEPDQSSTPTPITNRTA